ncbi:TPA: AraC family transcriptional regulator [Escherichia coli]|jgi:AraC-like DNA-binding protein|uniref:AraC family transcriptional regulator n=1 Tax=Escherichia coli TaxID=562 RepID=UPI0015834D31|nr:AraC family transcriptional regulator [Escherichia coli]MBB8657188.1 AraC family transcriptional regulator [Escherichia coli]MDA6771009.1 AraC family transcriptional regulator [Escherichia coli]MDO2500432.1 AraC family transcriptional regulator [Escherichia coli]MDO2552305.1 AraC family transcriptional regulator [Escherichia coli]MDO2596770.1 AraC family transcriptional regulator [Escherichia coli]
MDPLSDVLQLLSARSYITSGQTAGACWSMRYPGFPGMKFIALRKGHLWFRLEDCEVWTELFPGDAVILTRFAPFIMASDPTLTPVHSEQVPYQMRNGIADYGGSESIILAGKMDVDQAAAGQLLNVLPVVIPIRTGTDASSTLSWLMERIHEEKMLLRPGASLAGNHLIQLVMIEGIRSWILSEDSALKGWMGALRDTRILRALGAIHSEPEKNWQLSELAEIAGMSRASFARKFNESTGTTPLSYLTHWRMQIASRALRLSREPIKQIAFRLGYAAESTFSTVFKRVYGVSPKAHRMQYHEGPVYPLGPYRFNDQ